MSNEEEQKEDKEEQPTEDTGEGTKPESTPLIERGDATAERIEKAVESLREENDRAEKLRAHAALGGRSEAGTNEEKKEETPIEFSQKLMSGEVGIDGFLDMKNGSSK